MDARSEPAKAVAPEPRQRWRLVVGRAPDAPRLPQRETIEAWESAIDASGLPAARATSGPSRPKVSFGAPLQVGIAADAELMDLFLLARLPRWEVREALESRMPLGWRLVDLSDVWLGGPPLAGVVGAADYRIALEGGADSGAVSEACRSIIAAPSVPREREKGTTIIAYDLRPLLAGLEVVEAGPPVVIRARTRFHPVLGTGRPEEVVAAVSDLVGRPLSAVSVVRERLILNDELD